MVSTPKQSNLLRVALLLIAATSNISPCHAAVVTETTTTQWPIEQWDAVLAYVMVLLWAVVQCILHARLRALNKWHVYGITATALYIQYWIYIGLLWFFVGLVLAANGRIFSDMLAAVSAKTIAFLLLERIPPPPKGISECLDKIYKSKWIKWGYYYDSKPSDVEQGHAVEQEKTKHAIETAVAAAATTTDEQSDRVEQGTKVWVKYVQINVNDGKHRQLRKKLRASQFMPGAWEGIYETESRDGQGRTLKVNSLKGQKGKFDAAQLESLYELTEYDRNDDMKHVKGCIFSDYNFRVAMSLTKKNWLNVFHDECDGDWQHLVARQLQNFIPTEVLNVELQSNQTFIESNIYGRLRRRGLLPQGHYKPSLKDIKLFEAVVYESFLQHRELETIDEIVRIIYESQDFDVAAKEIFAYMYNI